MLKMHFTGNSKIWGYEKIWGGCAPTAPMATGLLLLRTQGYIWRNHVAT